MKIPENLKEIRKRAVPLFRRYGIKKAAIFGSFARGEERKSSDVDFLVELPKTMGLFEFSGLKIDLEEKLRRKVDLVVYGTIKPLLREGILHDQVLMYEKKS